MAGEPVTHLAGYQHPSPRTGPKPRHGLSADRNQIGCAVGYVLDRVENLLGMPAFDLPGQSGPARSGIQLFTPPSQLLHHFVAK